MIGQLLRHGNLMKSVIKDDVEVYFRRERLRMEYMKQICWTWKRVTTKS